MITKEKVLQDSKHYFNIASKAIKITNIEKRLSELGYVSLGGSYLYNLMGHADVDYGVYTPGKPNIDKIAQFVSDYLRRDEIIKLSIVNYTEFPRSRPTIPIGIWAGVKVNVGGELVNFDIWFLEQKNELHDDFAKLMPKDWHNNLTQDQKEAIIYTKALSRAGELDREYLSADIYRAIVLGGVNSPEEIVKWINKNPGHNTLQILNQ